MNYYIIHTGNDPMDDPSIIAIYNNEADARKFVEDYVNDWGERDRLQIARVMD